MSQSFGRIAAILSLVVLMTGCATQKEWMATSGSRADGTVRLSYEYGAFDVPKTNPQQGIDLASKKCAVWGYTGAEAFGSSERVCVYNDAFAGCTLWRMTASFQCTGAPSQRKPLEIDGTTTPISAAPGNAAIVASAISAKAFANSKSCTTAFGLVSDTDGRTIFEATCPAGDKLLIECIKTACFKLN